MHDRHELRLALGERRLNVGRVDDPDQTMILILYLTVIGERAFVLAGATTPENVDTYADLFDQAVKTLRID